MPHTDESTAQPTGDKKLYVDEDWKGRVEAERAAAEAASSPSEPNAAERTPAPGPSSPAAKGPSEKLPPADLQTLVSMLATQAMMSLGAMPNPLSGKVETDLAQARHFIDLLDVLEEKTRGNTTPEESQMFELLLHQLRLAFVTIEKQAAAAPRQ